MPEVNGWNPALIRPIFPLFFLSLLPFSTLTHEEVRIKRTVLTFVWVTVHCQLQLSAMFGKSPAVLLPCPNTKMGLKKKFTYLEWKKKKKKEEDDDEFFPPGSYNEMLIMYKFWYISCTNLGRMVVGETSFGRTINEHFLSGRFSQFMPHSLLNFFLLSSDPILLHT